MEATTKSEHAGLVEMKRLISEFLNGGEGSPQVRDYIASVFEDDALLLIYLKGRKYRANHAWETLKRKAEVCFNEYPDSFPETVPEAMFPLWNKGVFAMLKARDKFGRRIICFNMCSWEPKEISLEQISGAGTHFMNLHLLDEDFINNGIVFISNCDKIGMKHVKEYSLNRMLRVFNIFLYSYPIQFKGMYFLNVPFYARFIHKLAKPFLPKKLNERLIISAAAQQFDVLHEHLSPEILPKFLGGYLENGEAFDMSFLQHIK